MKSRAETESAEDEFCPTIRLYTEIIIRLSQMDDLSQV